jgi:hypothetical protein
LIIFYIETSFQICLLLRLIPEYNSNEIVQELMVMNNSGSDLLTLFSIDLPFLGNIQMYTTWYRVITISNINGIVDLCLEVSIEVQLVRNDNPP